MTGSSATAKSARSGRSTCRPTPTASAPGCASSGRTCSAKIRAQLGKLNRTMDAALKGHPYVKSGIDIACWDILGQAAGLPVCELLGGRYGDDFAPLSRHLAGVARGDGRASVAGYRAEGYRRFQLKVGGDPDVDIAAHPRRRREAAAGRPARRRRQHRLAAARGHARRARPCATSTSTSSSRA